MEKKVKVFGKDIEQGAIEQFNSVMALDCIKQGALMPDCHQGYVLPIGAVVASEGFIFPSFVGYDIGCGMCAFRTGRTVSSIKGKEKEIFDAIYKVIPCGEGLYREDTIEWKRYNIPHTKIIDEIMQKGISQIGTLGGGNHFIEIAGDENGELRVVIHSGSRGVGHKVATHYMQLAKENQPIDTTEREEEADVKWAILKERDLEKFEEIKGNYIQSKIKEVSGKGFEGLFGLDENSQEGKDYITDMNFCLQFALKNRMEMMRKVRDELCYFINGIRIDDKERPTNFLSMEKDGSFINRNHNHAEYKDGLRIHRKGATHAEKGMRGVIPGNMRDGSFVVVGKGNPDSLYSSSHGAGRVMGRKQASTSVRYEDFEKTMNGIVAKVTEETKDESPFVYKDIFEVMDLQKDLVNIKFYLKPIINIKG